MGTGIDVIVAALVGLLVGAIGTLAFRFSEREQRVEAEIDEDDFTGDEATILAGIPEITIILDAQNRALRAPAQALPYGIVHDDLLVHETVIDLVDSLRRTGRADPIDLTLKRGPVEGSGVIHVTLSVAPLSRGRVMVVIVDRTAEMRLDQMRRDFVANISHELKTPVGALGLLAETVEDSADDAEAVSHFARQMKKESRRLATLVQEIIDLSRLQEPDALANPERVEVDAVIDEAIDRVMVEVQSRDVTVRRGGTSNLYVMGDESLLVTAVRNLLDNAVRYTPDHHAVSIGTRAVDGMVRIAVVDQGIGIAEEAQRRVFERFYRVDDARSRETGGSGLGLSIVKHIAADHGGEVTLWSVPGRGSTFTLSIPQALDTREGVSP